MKTLKVLGILLTYPEKEVLNALPEMIEALKQEKWLSNKAISKIENFAAWVTMTDLLDVQEEYVALFDRTPSLSLHLFEHVHGDSRERGQAMVDLSDVYSAKGFEIANTELPDYLPMFLEYLSTQPADESRRDLGDVIDILSVIGKRLEKRKTRYADLFSALEELTSRKPDMKAVKKALEEASGELASDEELDEVWEEQFAFDNQTTDGSSCPMATNIVAKLDEAVELSKAKEA